MQVRIQAFGFRSCAFGLKIQGFDLGLRLMSESSVEARLSRGGVLGFHLSLWGTLVGKA